MDSHLVIEYVRIFSLVSCLMIAGYSDYSKLMVRDKIWIFWTLPATILLIIDFIILQLSIWNIFMIFLPISLAAVTVFEIPKFDSLNLLNCLLLLVYLFGIIGLFGGLLNYIDIDLYTLISGDEDINTRIWWTLLFSSLTIIIFILTYKIGLLQGGADIKALVWITLITPSWYFIPKPYIYSHTSIIDYDEILFQIPPSFVLFLWAGGLFIITPPFFLLRNTLKGDIKELSDLKTAWHATRIPLTEIKTDRIWLLSDVVLDNSGNKLHTVNLFIPQKNNHNQNLQEKIEFLIEKGLESAWVTNKHPFVTYLFIALIPMFIIGDPVAIIMNKYL